MTADVSSITDDLTADFLGREFLLWLWYRSETGFGRLRGASGEEMDVWVDDRLVLRGEGQEAQRFDLRGGAPATSEAARAAVREGRHVTAARFGMRTGEPEVHFELHEDLTLRSVKLPDATGVDDDPLRARLLLTDDLVGRVDDLYEAFCRVRLAHHWDSAEVPRILRWLDEPEDADDAFDPRG